MHSTSIRRAILAAVALVACAGRSKAQTVAARDSAQRRDTAIAYPRYRLRLLGVYDAATGAPLDSVEVRDMLSGLSSKTTKTGTVSLVFLPDGGSLVRIRKLGYTIQTLPIGISPADTAPITLVLDRVVTLNKVTVTDAAPAYRSPALQNVEQRMNSHNGGYFISESEMRKHDNSIMTTTVLAHFPGLFVAAGPHGEAWMLSSRTQCVRAFQCIHPNCYISVYLDGVKIYDPGNSAPSALPDFNRLSPQDYEIAEFYPGGASLPLEFGGMNNTCGALLLWTRER